MTHSNSYLFCCDWGTTSFRIRLADCQSKQVLQEIVTREGSTYVFDKWEASDLKSQEQRVRFYLDHIQQHIETFIQIREEDLSDTPVIISGMASSSVGMKELPYAHVPFDLDGSGVVTDHIYDEKHPRDIILVSGVRTDTDVMRGEEVQLMGMKDLIRDFAKDHSHIIVLLPGTHSKHVYIADNTITDFGTFLTGEMFELLSKNGLLKQSVMQSTPTEDPESWKHFRLGVGYAREKPLLQSLFSVRTNDLFRKMSKKDNYYYMSGLLIGYELKELKKREDSGIILCCPDQILPFYEHAIDELGLTDQTFIASSQALARYTVEAQLRIAEQFEKSRSAGQPFSD